MSYINYFTKEIGFKIVFYGPGLCGKTTNLKTIYNKVKSENKGKLISLATETERTMYFDFFPLELGSVKGYKVRFNLYTVPGQIYYSRSRHILMKGIDGVVFVADSQRERFEANLESLNDMLQTLKEYGIDFKTLPYVLQINKCDLPNIYPSNMVIDALKQRDEPVVEAMALRGEGVVETLKIIVKLVMMDVNKKLSKMKEPNSILETIKNSNLEKGMKYLLAESPVTQIPMEIINEGAFAVTGYLGSLKNKRKLYETKLIVVGEGAVGKTSLMRRLLFNEFSDNENITQGIEINHWSLDTEIADNLRINIWDFGGQDIYHATHQFFLTKRSLYILVWEARKDNDIVNFDYWLNIIKLLSDESAVIIVLTKIDQNVKLIDEVALKRKFKNIVAFFKVSAKTGVGIEDLRRFIRHKIVKLPYIGHDISQLWLEVRKNLENLDDNYIYYPQYKNISEKIGLDEDNSDFLSQYLHDLGVFLHFRDNPFLRNIIFLKPDWATGAVYKLVETKWIREKGGKFNYGELRFIWGKYPENTYIYLLELMKQFLLCFQIPNSQDYILPQLLPPNEPNFGWDYKDNVRFEYHYEFMPAGIIPRFIVRSQDLIENNLYWQNGVVLNWENSRALIVGDRLEKKIKIWIRGVDSRVFLEMIRRDIEGIHRTLNYPNVTELVPCICLMCREHNDSYFFDYSVLKKFREKGKSLISCMKSTEDVAIKGLLDGVEPILDELKDDSLKRILFSDQYKDMKKEKINIFLASSENLKEERERVELEVSRKNSLLISQKIFLDLKIWEKVSHSFSKTRKQDDFNKLVLESDIFICLIFDHIGEFTKEEFRIAYEGFKKNKKPGKIYVYFKNAPIETGNIPKDFQSVLDFKEEIKKHGQFYNTYSNLSDLILQVNKNLEMDLREFKN